MAENKMSLNEIMKKAQDMQHKLQEIQKQVAETKVWGIAGGGQVKVEMNGLHHLLRAVVEPAVLKEDKSVLEDLFVAATNDATNKIEKILREKMGGLAGVSLPDGLA